MYLKYMGHKYVDQFHLKITVVWDVKLCILKGTNVTDERAAFFRAEECDGGNEILQNVHWSAY
jgi:hypothetical protein